MPVGRPRIYPAESDQLRKRLVARLWDRGLALHKRRAYSSSTQVARDHNLEVMRLPYAVWKPTDYIKEFDESLILAKYATLEDVDKAYPSFAVVERDYAPEEPGAKRLNLVLSEGEADELDYILGLAGSKSARETKERFDVRPPRNPLNKAAIKLATSINRARRCGFNPEYQAGILACAKAIAEDHVVPGEHASFFLCCGLDWLPKGD